MVKNTSAIKYKKVRIKGKYYDMVREKTHTRAIRDPKSGRLMGRYSGVPRYAADDMKYIVLKKDFDIDKDKKPDLFKGQIISRVKKRVLVKPRYVDINVDASKYKKRR